MPGVKGRSGGHNAKTVEAHKLAGTFQKVRHGQITNPDPPKGDPVPPKRLTGDAKKEWGRMIVRLTASKTLSTVDDGALYQYCRLFSETERLAKQQREAGQRVESLESRLEELQGEVMVEAYQTLTTMVKVEAAYGPQIRMGRMALRTYLVEFGLTPASRGRVKQASSAGDDDDGFSDLDDDDTIQ